MKKIMVLLSSILLWLSSQAQIPGQLHFTVLVDPQMGGVVYPSFIIANSQLLEPSEDESDMFSFSLENLETNSTLSIIIEETPYNSKTIYRKFLSEVGEYVLSPYINWNHEALLSLSKPTTQLYTFICEINGKEIDRKQLEVQLRSINECVWGYNFTDGVTDEMQFEELSHLFGLYVDEDNPKIGGILKQIVEAQPGRLFTGCQGDQEDEALEQLFWVWEYFSKRGQKYGKLSQSTPTNTIVASQFVRLFDQTINDRQATSVDGTFMLASIYQKMGFETCVISLPNHLFLGIVNPYQSDAQQDAFWFIETSLMGSNPDPRVSFEKTLCAADDIFSTNMDENPDSTFVVYITDCRDMGIRPIRKQSLK